jgi:hypothetical protein
MTQLAVELAGGQLRQIQWRQGGKDAQGHFSNAKPPYLWIV